MKMSEIHVELNKSVQHPNTSRYVAQLYTYNVYVNTVDATTDIQLLGEGEAVTLFQLYTNRA